jgi:hypothetical protein
MDPHERFCHNEGCRASGRKGEGHIVIHSRKERRYRCKRCKRTFSETKGTALYRMHEPKEPVLTVLTLLARGGPLQARSAGLSASTSGRWRAGRRRPGCTVGGCMSVWWRPVESSWGKFGPTSYG